MTEWIKRGVAAAFAAVGGWLVASGIVDADTWAGVVTPEVTAGITAILGVVIYGVGKVIMDLVSDMWSAE